MLDFKYMPHVCRGLAALAQAGKDTPANVADTAPVKTSPLATRRLASLPAQAR